MPTKLPNPSIIRYLVDNYYLNGARDSLEIEFISSHWKNLIDDDYFDCVKVDAEGGLVSISGKPWGCEWRGIKHRITDRLCMLSHLVHLNHRRELIRLRKMAVKVCDMAGLAPTFTVFIQVCHLALVMRYLPDHMHQKRLHIVMIGDGSGVLSALVKFAFPNSTIIMVDIGQSLLYQAYHLQKAYPDCTHELGFIDAIRFRELDDIDFVFCPTEHLEALERFKFDIAINNASMQEMNASTIERYFAFLRKCFRPNNIFYCCNRESKILPGGEVSEILKYPWRDDDRYLVDGYCPWYKYYFSPTVERNGLQIFGARVPYVNFYDGKTIYRLAVLATN